MVQKLAPGEARTLDLRISSSILTYKYDALTDCATGAEFNCPVIDGYYYSTVHFIYGSRNIYTSATYSLQTTIHVPKTTLYQILVAYTMSSVANIILTIRLQKMSFVLSSSSLPNAVATFCDSLCYKLFYVNSQMDFSLEVGTWNVTISAATFESQLRIEKVIIIPQLFLTASIFTQVDRNWFLSNCNVTTNDMRIGTAMGERCLSHVYSLTTFFNNGALSCDCHMMGSLNSTCAKYGGQCFCKNGVGERDCSKCLPGFYNFSSTGCIPCGCKGPNKTCDPVTGLCDCPVNTVGRVCDACSCNGNSNQCLRNGDCLNCSNNSTSTRCELCATGFFGNAINQTSCNCHIHGSHNETCLASTGQCHCKTGVIGVKCNSCLPNYYGLVTSGCFPCNCNAIGSASMQCNATGQCQCIAQAAGLRCDQCQPGYFGLPAKTCQPCNCDPKGTISGTFCASDVTGQCHCKPGVTGRTCSQCLAQYVNFTKNGCEQCPLCTRQMQTAINVLKSNFLATQLRVNETKNMTFLQREIDKIQQRATSLQLAAVLHDQRIQKGQTDISYLTRTYLTPISQRNSALIASIARVSTKATSQNSIAISNVAKMKELELSASTASSLSQNTSSTATSIFMSLGDYTTSSSTLVAKAHSEIQKLSLTMHQSMFTTINADLAMSNAVSRNVTAAGVSVQSQQSLSSSITTTTQNSSATIAQWNSTWRQQLPQFLLDVQNVYKKGLDVTALLNSTKNLVTLQDQYVKDTNATQAKVQAILQEATSVYQLGLAVYEQSKIHTIAVTGTLQVSILQFISNTLTVKVLKATGLAARDFPSMLSDPYFRVSLVPNWGNAGFKTSPIINGTLNPTWPVGDSYMFSLTSVQLFQTLLIVQLYDKDPLDADDFIGEVVINVGAMPAILSGTVTSFYPVRMQGYSSIWNGALSSSQNTITDLQSVLTNHLSTVTTLMLQAESAATQAESAANSLQAQAALLTANFSSAKNYASTAVNAVNTYREIYRLINESIIAANKANETATQITQQMQGLSFSTLQANVDAAMLESQALLTASKARNISYPTYRLYLRSETLGSSGISNPPRSRIEVEGIDYSKHLNGFNIVILDLKSGFVDSSVNFRLDIDPNAAKKMIDYLNEIAVAKTVLIVKQGQANIPVEFKIGLVGQLISLGAEPPYVSGSRGSYALIGYKRVAGETISWTRQVARTEGQGISEIQTNLRLSVSLNEMLTSALTTFQSAWPLWTEVNKQFSTLQSISQQFLVTESIATIVQVSLQAANLMLNDAEASATRVLSESTTLKARINDITMKYNEIVNMVQSSTSAIANASATVNQAETRLPLQTSIVQLANRTSAQNNATRDIIDSKILSIEAKLAKLKSTVMQIPFAIKFEITSSSVYTLQGYSSSTSRVLYNSAGFDMRVNSTNGVIFYILSQPGKIPYSIGLYLRNSYLHLIYHLGFGQTVVRNEMKIELNQWYYVYFGRQGKDGILSVRNSTGWIITARVTSAYASDSVYMDFSSSSRVYLSGFASGFMASLVVLYGQSAVTMDNLVINNIRYNLWSYTSSTGQITYAETRYGFRPTIDGTWISFYGNGFLRQNVGTFKINSEYSEIQLEFRTLRDNTVIFGVTDASGSFVYGLYLVNGKLLFQFATGVGQNAALITARNTYANGNWYKVRLVRTTVNATLSVTLLGSTNAADSETIVTVASTVVPQGYQIIFGAPPTSSSIKPLVSGVFAGDLRNLFLTNSLTNQLQKRSFNGSEKVSQYGVAYYEMISTQIVAGTRFYGYMWWQSFGSYSTLLRGLNSLIKSISFVFKTTQMTGLIMYSSDNNQYLQNQGFHVYFYMGLFGGNLVLTLHDNNFATLSPFLSQNLTLSDGKWHNVTLVYLGASYNYQLRVDGKIIFTGWFGNFKREIAASSQYYFGGIPSTITIPFAVPAQASLKMDVQNLFINYRLQNFHQSVSYGVSKAGVSLSAYAPQLPKPAPTCGTAFPSIAHSAIPSEVQFDSVPWTGSQPYIGFELSAAQKFFLKMSFVITLEFKATARDGIIFHIANNQTNPTQYVSLEMVDGKLQFQFSSGTGPLTVSTTRDYSQGSKWHLIHMLRINQFIAILIPQSKEYQSNYNFMPGKDFIVGTPVYIGGLPTSIVAKQFVNRNNGFKGCLRRYEVASDMKFFALNYAAPTFAVGANPCYANVETGAYFNTTSWILYDNNFVFGENFTMKFSFRTYHRSGLFFYLFSNDTTNGVDVNTTRSKYMIFEMTVGKINLHYKPIIDQPAEIISWIDPNSNYSHLICDQQWHNVQIVKLGDTMTISVDYFTSKMQLTRSAILVGNLYIGGLPDHILKPGNSARTFNGCLKSFSFGNQDMMRKAKSGQDVGFGCPVG
eukprot:gene10016-11039_t